MSTREWIEAKIQTMDEAQLAALYPIVESIAERKSADETLSFMEKLGRIQIDAPPDFSANHEAYASGEKSVE